MIRVLSRAPVGWRVAFTWSLVTGIALGVRVAPWVPGWIQELYRGLGLPDAEAAFLTLFTVASLVGLGILLTLRLVVAIERPDDWKALFLLRRDWRGFFILLALRYAVGLLELWFLRAAVWRPVQSWLLDHGAWRELPLPDTPRQFLFLNLGVLVLVSWVEMVEEIYFRGYLQGRLTESLGTLWGLGLSLLLWDLWHLWNPSTFVRRFVTNVPTALVVHYRRSVWSSMWVHPLLNRLGTLRSLLGEG